MVKNREKTRQLKGAIISREYVEKERGTSRRGIH
jgi:hypothetical protein